MENRAFNWETAFSGQFYILMPVEFLSGRYRRDLFCPRGHSKGDPGFGKGKVLTLNLLVPYSSMHLFDPKFRFSTFSTYPCASYTWVLVC